MRIAQAQVGRLAVVKEDRADEAQQNYQPNDFDLIRILDDGPWLRHGWLLFPFEV